MSTFITFVKQLHRFSGYRLILNVAGMVLIGLFEGISILLIIPLLGIIGVIGAASLGSIPFGHLIDHTVISSEWALPLILLFYVALLIGVALLQRNNSILNTRIQQGFIRHLRIETYQTLLQSGWRFFLTQRKSDFQHVLTSELARVSQGTMLFMQLLASLIFTFIQIILALWLSPLLTLVVLLCGLCVGFFARNFIRYAKKLGDNTTALSQDYYFGINDQLSGMKEIKSNMLEAVYIDWFRTLNRKMESNNVGYVILRSNSQFFYRMIAALLIAVFVYAAIVWMRVNPEHLLVLVLIFSRIWPRFSSMQTQLEQIVSMIPAFRQLTDLQEAASGASEMQDAETALLTEPLRVKECIECQNISFRYEQDTEEYVLRNVNLRIPAYAMTAIVGKSGAGKSTLVDMIMGLIQPQEGELRVDGEKIDSSRLVAWRKSISYVSQDPFLFHMSIRDNVKLGHPEATDAEIWEALQMSAASKFVERLPEQLDTIVGDRGIRLSGGEKQRIVLARALLRKPDVLVLDEATSALDVDNEEKVQEALFNLKHKVTLIVIAHRLSTIRHADQVIVLEKGRVVQRGDFRELVEDTEGAFSYMWSKQTKSTL